MRITVDSSTAARRAARELTRGAVAAHSPSQWRWERRFVDTLGGDGRALCVGMLCFALSACDGVVLEFSELGIGGIRQTDEVGEALCSEPETAPSPGPDASLVDLDSALECSDFPNDCLGEFSKCTLVDDDSDQLYRSACVPERGQLQLGECCERTTRGDDGCAAGGWCTPLGIGRLPEGPMACRALCAENANCPEQQRCLAVTTGHGVCVEPCQLFGTECIAPAVRCVPGADVEGSYFGYCARYGAGGDGEPCESDGDCGLTLVCEQSGRSCRHVCDGQHPCPEDQRCLPLGLGDPDSPRVCQP